MLYKRTLLGEIERIVSIFPMIAKQGLLCIEKSMDSSIQRSISFASSIAELLLDGDPTNRRIP